MDCGDMAGTRKQDMNPSHFRQKGIKWWQREGETPHDKFIFSNLKEDSIRSVLEIGPGRGAFTFRIRDRGCQVVALEVNPEFIDHCRKKGDCTGIHFVEGDAMQLPFKDGLFDAVICIEVLMHLPDPAKAFREMSRVMRPKGSILVSYVRKYTGKHLKFAVSVRTGIYEKRHGKGTVDYRYDSLGDVKKFIKGTGLSIENVSDTKSLNPCLLVRKQG